MRKVLTSEEVGFEQSKVDQCLFVKMTVKRPLMLPLCVDDSAVVGHRSDTDEFFESARKTFKVKLEGKLNNFLGCDMSRGKEKMSAGFQNLIW